MIASSVEKRFIPTTGNALQTLTPSGPVVAPTRRNPICRHDRTKQRPLASRRTKESQLHGRIRRRGRYGLKILIITTIVFELLMRTRLSSNTVMSPEVLQDMVGCLEPHGQYGGRTSTCHIQLRS